MLYSVQSNSHALLLGRALGEVTKYLVYNVRKRQEGGDCAANYFSCTESVAGVEDVRFQSLMPDALHWLGVTKVKHSCCSWLFILQYSTIVVQAKTVCRLGK